MKIAIKVIILALAASVLFSCAQEQIAVSDTTASVEATTAESSRELSERERNIASYNYPNINYDGYVFKIALRGEEGGNGYYDSYDIVCEEASADPVLDGVYKRNREIEDRFGITIKGIFVGDTSAAVRKSVSSGDHAYDIGFQQLRSSHTLALNGVLVDMRTVDSLDLSNPWWDQTILHDTSIMNKSMYATGDITVVDNYGTWIMMYNKKLQKDFNVPDLYALVRSGEWTFEKLSELMKLSIEDLNGDGKISKEDRVGMATSTDSIRNFFFSSGSRIIGKDANDLPFNALDTVQTINNIELIDKVFNPPAKCVVLTDETGSWENTQAMFTEDRALFYAEVMLHVQSIREMESDFGILPLPKASVEQERYYTSAHEMASAAVFIPVGHDGESLERAGYITEALAWGGLKYVTPAYYDIALKSKYARDDESAEMLDIILAGRSADLGYIANLGNALEQIVQGVVKKSGDFASRIEKTRAQMEKAINSLITKYEGL